MIIEPDALYHALQCLKGVAPKKCNLPILAHVHIRPAASSMVEVIATDLEVSMKVEVFAHGPLFHACFPFQTLYDLARTSGGSLCIEERDGFRYQIESGSGVVEISGMDLSDYPAYPDTNPETEGTVKCQDLVKVLGSVISSDRIPVLFDGDYSRIVSTDGHRMNTQVVDWLPSGRIMIMGSDTKRLAKSIERAVHKNREVMFGRTDKEAIIRSDGFEARIRLQDYKWVELGFTGNPEELPAAWIQDKDLKKALKLAKVMTNASIPTGSNVNYTVKNPTLRLHFRPFRMTFKTELPDVGSCSHTVECYVPAELCGQEILVNLKYVEQASKKLSGNIPIRAVGNLAFVGDELIMQMKRPEPKQEERKEAA